MFPEHKILEWFLKGSCHTEDWSNDAENSKNIYYILIYNQIENSSFEF